MMRSVWWRDSKMDYQKNEQIEETDSLHVDTDSQKLKVYQNIFGTAWSKMSVASLIMGL